MAATVETRPAPPPPAPEAGEAPRRRRRVGPVGLACAFVACWAVLPLAMLVGRVLLGDETPTGAFGVVAIDQLQYLAWIREAGDHGLISNLFRVEDSDAVFLHPLFLASGLLWKLGLPIQLAYLLWAPVAILVMLAGVLAYVRRLLPSASARAAGILLAFFLAAPIWPLVDAFGRGLYVDEVAVLRAFGGQLSAITFMWGYMPKAISVGLMPLVFLAAERALADDRRRAKLLALAAAGAVGVSLMHPWQGVTLILVLGGLLAWHRLARPMLPLVAVMAAGGLPVLYYFALSRLNDDWAIAAVDQWPEPTLVMWVVAAVGLSPILGLAAWGARRPRTLQDKVLILWPLACVPTLFLPSSGWYYAVAGASIPLAILLVRGWRSLPLGGLRARGLTVPVGAALIAAVALPGMIYETKHFADQVQVTWYQYYSDPGEVAALEFLRNHREPGAVVATPGYGAVVPALTGRRVWNGHFAWTPSFLERGETMDRMMAGVMPPADVRRTLAGSGARFFISDCRYDRPHVARALGKSVTPLRAFGCATVYRIAVRAG